MSVEGAGSTVHFSRVLETSHFRENVIFRLVDEKVDRVEIRRHDESAIWTGTWPAFETDVLALLPKLAIFALALGQIREIDPDAGDEAVLTIVDLWKKAKTKEGEA